MRYLVLLWLGRHEDQELAALPLIFQGEGGLTERQILESFVLAVDEGRLEFEGPTMACPNHDCRREGVPAAGGFCTACGTALAAGAQTNDRLLEFMKAEVFGGKADGFPQEVIDALDRRGWDLWPGTYKAERIASICGVLDYLNDPQSWCDSEFGRTDK